MPVRSNRPTVAGIVIVLIGLVVSWLVADHDRRLESESLQTRFHAEIDRTLALVESALDRYVVVVDAAEAVVAMDPDLTQAEYEDAIDRVVGDTDAEALAAANFVILLDADEVDEVIATRQSVSIAPSEVFPITGADEVAPVWLLWPREPNLPALGYDILSRPISVPSIERSRIERRPIMSDALTIVQESEQQNTIILYNPVYVGDEMLGWTNILLRGQQFLDGIIGSSDLIAFRIVDETSEGAKILGQLPVDHDFGTVVAPSESRPVDVYGQTWRFDFVATEALTSTLQDDTGVIMATGLLLSMLVAFLAHRVLRSREDALDLVEQRTARLAEANQRLLAAAASKDEFLSVVSHEFRTPLTVIRGGHDLLEDTLADDQQTVSLLDRMRRNIDRLQRLVDDLLITAQFEDGRVRAHSEIVDLDRVVRAVTSDLGMTNEVVVEIEPGTSVMADPEHVERSITNLLTNAARYGTPPVTISAETVADRVVIDVADRGSGVPTEILPRLFDRFEQGDSGSTRRSTGVGLGLHIVKRLVELNGGSIAYLGSGEGARFVIELPVGSVARQIV